MVGGGVDIDQRRLYNQHMDEFVDSREALRLLGIKPASLYSYVSRGVIRRVQDKGSGASLYSRADIERQIARKGARKGHRATAGASLQWGDPVLESSISFIEADGPYYRGVSFRTLADSPFPAFERSAELLWSGLLPSEEVRWQATQNERAAGASPHERAQRKLLCLLTEADGPTLDISLVLARKVITSIASDGRSSEGLSIAELFAKHWGIRGPERMIDAALVACAEHELNSSTFVARNIASTGAHLVQCLLGAVAAHSGPKHGGASLQLEKLLHEVQSPSSARKLLAAAVASEKPLPGFGHPLYPKGDPRAIFLFELTERYAQKSLSSSRVGKLCKVAEEEYGLKPNIDAGLVALAECIGAPEGTASELFLVGRFAGWIAHVLDQRLKRVLLRPRAHYTDSGPAPL